MRQQQLSATEHNNFAIPLRLMLPTSASYPLASSCGLRIYECSASIAATVGVQQHMPHHPGGLEAAGYTAAEALLAQSMAGRMGHAGWLSSGHDQLISW
jgi:hypothetical protein